VPDTSLGAVPLPQAGVAITQRRQEQPARVPAAVLVMIRGQSIKGRMCLERALQLESWTPRQNLVQGGAGPRAR
jgi:hypothetical protein